MNRAVEIGTIGEGNELRGHITEAKHGASVIYKEGGKAVAVLIPASAFRAVQKLISITAREMLLTCWDDPLVAVSAAIADDPHAR